MAVQTFSCPECDHLLRSSNPIAAGKKVRCPRCQAVFPAPAEAAAASTAVKKAAVTHASRSAATDDDVDEAPVTRRREEAVAPPRKLNRAARDADDDVDEEEQERQERPRKKKKKKASSAIPLLLGFGGGAVLVGIFLVLGFVAPGFLLSKSDAPKAPGGGPAAVDAQPGAPEGPANVLAYAPADSAVLAGVNVGLLRARPDFAQSIQQMRLLMAMQGMPGELADLAMDVDQVLVAVPSEKKFVLAVSTVQPYDADKVMRGFKANPSQPIQGRQAFRVDDMTLIMPSKRVVVFSNLSEPELAKVVTATQVNLDKGVEQQVGKLKSSMLWALALNKGPVQQGLLGLDAAQLQKTVFGAEKLLPYLQKSQLAFATLDLNKTLDLKVGILCADPKDAQAVSVQAQDLWGRHGKKYIGMGKLMMGFQKGLEPVGELLNDVERSFKVTQQGAEVTASVQVSEKTIKSLEQLQQNFGGPGFNPGFNPGAGPNRGGGGPPGPGAPPLPPRKGPPRS